MLNPTFKYQIGEKLIRNYPHFQSTGMGLSIYKDSEWEILQRMYEVQYIEDYREGVYKDIEIIRYRIYNPRYDSVVVSENYFDLKEKDDTDE